MNNYISKAVDFLCESRDPSYLENGNFNSWDMANRQVCNFIHGLPHDLDGAEQVNVLDILRWGEPRHIDMMKSTGEINHRLSAKDNKIENLTWRNNYEN